MTNKIQPKPLVTKQFFKTFLVILTSTGSCAENIYGIFSRTESIEFNYQELILYETHYIKFIDFLNYSLMSY